MNRTGKRANLFAGGTPRRRLAGPAGFVIRMLALLVLAVPLAAQEPGRYGHYDVHDTDLLPRSEFAARRAAVLRMLDSTSAMLVRSVEERTRSNDVSFPFRQRNSMLYLTGVEETESALLLVPQGVRVDGNIVRELLFVAPRNPRMELWLGVRMGPEVAPSVTGIPVVLSYTRLRGILDSLLPSLHMLYYDGWLHGSETEPLTGTTRIWDREMKKDLGPRAAHLQVQHAGMIIDSMRVIKSPAEVELLRRAVEISMEAHRETIRNARPGMHEYELEAVMESEFLRRGSESPGYPSIVGSGPNTCILHYESNRRRTEPGDLVLMDCGAEYHGYSADITRTFPVSGTFTPEQRAIYEIVAEAQREAIDACRAGNSFLLPHRKAVRVIAAGLVRLGIIHDEAEYIKHFMHGTSHFLGLDVHDVGNVHGRLRPGMVMTVEPGIYIAAGSDCDPKWWNIGVRIEDDVVITDDDPLNLSAGLAHTADEIEQLMQR